MSKRKSGGVASGKRSPARVGGGGLTYAASGVDIDEGDRFVDLIQQHVRRTHGPRVLHNPWGFAGLFRLDYNESLFKRNFREPVLLACTDGVGTKIALAVEMNRLDTIGIDLVAMSVNDLVVQGGEPLIFLDYIACGKLVPERLEAIVRGIAQACRECGAALLGGETAEMPDVYRPDDIDLAGFAVGVAELSRVTDPGRVDPGDVVIGLESDGVHSNGYSLVRRIVREAGLDLSKKYRELDAKRSLGEVLLQPTRLYAKPVVKLLRRYTVKKVITGMAHITGGGLADNLARALHPKVDAVLSRSAWTPHPVFPFLQKHGNVSAEEMDRVFNMGIGYCFVVKPAFATSVKGQLKRMGERAMILGRIERGSGRVRIE
ncbi:MAG: phosphoribosylformylglycinamidine cyclo-ligase [Planctomycetota bacterium]|nr:phosphoribosylformylglycinamidine cyclo-ligase [Planctomycetota bacterium]